MDIFKAKSLNEISRKIFGKANYTNREKVKKILLDNGIDWKQWLKDIKESSKKHCIVCGKELEKNQVKFCSHSCSAKYNNTKRKKEKEIETVEIIKTVKVVNYCKNCGEILNEKQKNFCSGKCQRDYAYTKYIEDWKNGKENGLKGEYGISNHIRRYLFEKNDCKCEVCGWGEKNEFTDKIPLEVHHKDGNYKNNKEENLQLLCPNCHSLTDTYKSHNKSGRKDRTKYK